MTGVELIAKERQRQIEEEGWSAKHDDQHTDGSLALAAVCYATPIRLYKEKQFMEERAVLFHDPWPISWDKKWDKRYCFGECRGIGANYLPDPLSYNDEERINLLTKAGALIAAEIDRLKRK